MKNSFMNIPFNVVSMKWAWEIPFGSVLIMRRSACGKGELVLNNFRSETDNDERERLAMASIIFL
jgi:hypothetical protein